MDIEQKQAELIDHFVNQASTLKASALWPLIIEATSHPSLFAFSEILSSPTVSEVFLLTLFSTLFFHVVGGYYRYLIWFEFCWQLEGTENSFCLDVLRLFAHGTWSDYKSKHSSPSPLSLSFALTWFFYFFELCMWIHVGVSITAENNFGIFPLISELDD